MQKSEGTGEHLRFTSTAYAIITRISQFEENLKIPQNSIHLTLIDSSFKDLELEPLVF